MNQLKESGKNPPLVSMVTTLLGLHGYYPSLVFMVTTLPWSPWLLPSLVSMVTSLHDNYSLSSNVALFSLSVEELQQSEPEESLTLLSLHPHSTVRLAQHSIMIFITSYSFICAHTHPTHCTHTHTHTHQPTTHCTHTPSRTTSLL